MKKASFVLIVLLLGSVSSGAILRVPGQYSTIQAAIDAAGIQDTVVVAQGIYTGSGNRDINFKGKPITVRSETGPEHCIIDCNGAARGFYFGTGESASSVLEGFTITNGFARDFGAGIYCSSSSPIIRNCNIKGNRSWNLGGGVGLKLSNAIISDCNITDNLSDWVGGGIFCSGGGQPTIERCIITGNGTLGIMPNTKGGAVSVDHSTAIIRDCIITDNTAGSTGDGGGIAVYMRSATDTGKVVVEDCVISGNSALRGAGIWCDSHAVVVKNCAIVGNAAGKEGGGIWGYSFEIKNSIIAANRAGDGGGFCSTTQSGIMPALQATNSTIVGNLATNRGGGIYYLKKTDARFTNCILWGNADGNGTGAVSQIHSPLAAPMVIYSCIQDDQPNDDNIPFGGGQNENIDDDPMFVRLPGDNNDYGDLHLRIDSPCINAGSSLFTASPENVDMDGQPRVIGPVVDIGADEYAPMIIVTKPQGGEVWTDISRHKVEWCKYGVGSVDVLFSKDGGGNWKTIAGGISGDNSIMWQLPKNVDSNQCLISVVPSDGDANVLCINSGKFAIQKYPQRPWVPPGWARREKLPGKDLSLNCGPQSGCVKWVFQTDGAVSSGVAVRGGGIDVYTMYAADEAGKVYALEPNGTAMWTFDAGTPIVGSPVVGYYRSVYVGGEDGRLYAIDGDGKLQWTHTTNKPIYSTPVVASDGKIYICSQDGLMYALGADGSELWDFETSGFGKLKGAIFATPERGKGKTIYAAGLYDPNLYALDSNDGTVRWVCNFEFAIDPYDPNKGVRGGWPFASPAVGPDGTIYQTLLFDTYLYAIDANNGNIKWAANLADPCSGWFEPNYSKDYGGANGWSQPVIGPDGTIYVSFDDPYLRAVNPDGTIKWVTHLGTVGGFTMSVGRNGLIYAASDDSYVYVVTPGGEQITRFKGDGWVSFPVIPADNMLIISDSNNKVWAISSEGCSSARRLPRIAGAR